MRWFWIALGTIVLSGALAGVVLPVTHLGFGLTIGTWTLRAMVLVITAVSFVIVWTGANSTESATITPDLNTVRRHH